VHPQSRIVNLELCRTARDRCCNALVADPKLPKVLLQPRELCVYRNCALLNVLDTSRV